MKRSIIATLALALFAIAAPITQAQDADQPITMTVQPLNCGRATTPLYCWGIPLNINGVPAGSAWLDTYVTGYNAGTGFVAFPNPVADLGQGSVTGNTVLATDSNGRPTKLLVNFTGQTNDGDAGVYTGSMVLTLSYYYSSGGGGRGGGGAGWRMVVTGGTVTIQYQ